MPSIIIDRARSQIVKALKQTRPSGLISGIAAIFLLLHLFFPKLPIDSITLGLFAILVLPWLQKYVKIIKIADMEIKFQSIDEEIAASGLLGNPSKEESMPVYISSATDDPRLAISGLRLEIESRLIDIGRKNGITESMPLFFLMKKLFESGVLSEKQYDVLKRMRELLNSAAYGVETDRRAVEWAINVGPSVLAGLGGLYARSKQ